MAKLLVVRHSYAEASNPAGDFYRNLTPVGLQLAEKLGEQLATEEFKVNTVLASAAIRAVETADTILTKLNYEVDDKKYLKELYNCTDQDWVDHLKQIKDNIINIVLVGHEPVMSSLVFRLSDKHVKLSPCNAYLFNVDNWQSIEDSKLTSSLYFNEND